ncbi:MAG: hypothetical protein V4714_07250 [Bacteroidota bacterium]
MNNYYLRFITFLIGSSLLITRSVRAQESDEGLRVVTQANGHVYVYHTADMLLAQGLNVYRKDAGDFKKLNTEPIRAVRNGTELAESISAGLFAKLQASTEQDNATGLFLKLRSNRKNELLVSFVYPEIAWAMGRLFVDSTARPNSTVTYKIEFVNAQGKPTDKVLTRTLLLQPKRPDAPGQLKASNQAERITLTWNYAPYNRQNLDNVMYFDVYRQIAGSANAEKMNEEPILRTSDERTFQFRTNVPTLGKSYQFFVTAVDLSGQSSVPSQSFTLTAKDNVPPAYVQDVKTFVSADNTVLITWPVSVESDAVGYYVYRAPRSIDPFKKLNDKPLRLLDNRYQDKTTVGGQPYQYRITAIDASGNESEFSNAAAAFVKDQQAPPPVTSLSATFATDNKAVLLKWKAEKMPTDFRTFVIIRQKVERETSLAYAQLNETAWKQTTFTDAGIAKQTFPEGEYYRYGIAAMDSSANYSDTTFAILQIPDKTPPKPPVAIAASIEPNLGVNLTWNASVSTDVKLYQVFRRKLGSPTDSLLVKIPAAQARIFRDDKARIGTTYLYCVNAIDSLGNMGAKSAADTLKMRDFSSPAKVRNVQALASATGVFLQWEPTQIPDLAGYRIYMSDLATGFYKLVQSIPSKETHFTDPRGKAGQWYQIRAIDTSSNESPPGQPTQAVGKL